MEEVISKGDSILVSYKGNLSAGSLDILFQDIEEKLARAEIEQKKKKKVYYISVECLQNVYRHAPFRSTEQQEVEFAIVQEKDNCIVATGNYILNQDVPGLSALLEEIIGNANPMQEKYRERLSTGELSEKGGAGLGFIDMKRKSKGMKFGISPSTGGLSYFLLEVLL